MRTYNFLLCTVFLLPVWGGLVEPLLQYQGPATASLLPGTLSETGFTGRQADGFVPYRVNAPVWKNRTLLERWVSVPGAASIIPGDSTGYEFPRGTAFIMNLSMAAPAGVPGTPVQVETQFLIKDPAGIWQPVSYLWRNDQKEADLVNPDAAFREPPLSFAVEEQGEFYTQHWWPLNHIGCRLCHLPESNPLGFVTPQLWGPDPVDHGANRLDRLVRARVLAGKPDSAAILEKGMVLNWAAMKDSTGSLQHRAASYLAVNCGSCHFPGNPQGPIGEFSYFTPSGIDLLIEAGARGDYVLPPGKPDSSHIILRMVAGEMPSLPSVFPDFDAIYMLWDWMNDLGGTSVPRPGLTLETYLSTPVQRGPLSGNVPGFLPYPGKLLISSRPQMVWFYSLRGRLVSIRQMNEDAFLPPEGLASGRYLMKLEKQTNTVLWSVKK